MLQTIWNQFTGHRVLPRLQLPHRGLPDRGSVRRGRGLTTTNTSQRKKRCASMGLESKIHVHHLLPRHVVVWDDSMNLVECSVAEHAEHHRYLWETFNYYEDYAAWQALAGHLPYYDAREIVRRAKVSTKLKGVPIKGMRKIGWKQSKTFCKTLSKRQMGNTIWVGRHHKESTKVLQSAARKDGHWYHNGTIETYAKSCPEGFIVGRLKR
jgi:hypothetical protein